MPLRTTTGPQETERRSAATEYVVLRRTGPTTFELVQTPSRDGEFVTAAAHTHQQAVKAATADRPPPERAGEFYCAPARSFTAVYRRVTVKEVDEFGTEPFPELIAQERNGEAGLPGDDATD